MAELSRRAMFTTGLSRVLERGEPASVAAARPAAGPSWPRGDGADLWAPAAAALPRPPGQHVLDVDELDLDLASLPYEDAQLDGIVSAFGPMFSRDGRAAIDELFRVVRPGGTVAFTAWTGRGIIGRLLKLAAAHEPLPPGIAPPLAWGREERLRQELERHSDDARMEPAELALRFESCERAVERLFSALGPLVIAPRQDELRPQARVLVDSLAVAHPAGIELPASYLLVVAERRLSY